MWEDWQWDPQILEVSCKEWIFSPPKLNHSNLPRWQRSVCVEFRLGLVVQRFVFLRFCLFDKKFSKMADGVDWYNVLVHNNNPPYPETNMSFGEPAIGEIVTFAKTTVLVRDFFFLFVIFTNCAKFWTLVFTQAFFVRMFSEWRPWSTKISIKFYKLGKTATYEK